MFTGLLTDLNATRGYGISLLGVPPGRRFVVETVARAGMARKLIALFGGQLPPRERNPASRQRLLDALWDGEAAEQLAGDLDGLMIVMTKFLRAVSEGSVRLASRDARAAPVAAFNYFAAPEDARTCVDLHALVARVLRHKALVPFGAARITSMLQLLRGAVSTPVAVDGDVLDVPGVFPPLPSGASEAAVVQWCRDIVVASHHFHNSCALGAVLDEAFRVDGVARLRVVDASALPLAAGTHPQASLMMMGRYAALRIRSTASRARRARDAGAQEVPVLETGDDAGPGAAAVVAIVLGDVAAAVLGLGGLLWLRRRARSGRGKPSSLERSVSSVLSVADSLRRQLSDAHDSGSESEAEDDSPELHQRRLSTLMTAVANFSHSRWESGSSVLVRELSAFYPDAARDPRPGRVPRALARACARYRARHTAKQVLRVAVEGKGPQRRPQKRLDRRLEEVAKAVGGGYCRLQMPWKLALAVRGTVAGHRLDALEVGRGWYLPPFQCIPAGALQCLHGIPLRADLRRPRGVGGRQDAADGVPRDRGVACALPRLRVLRGPPAPRRPRRRPVRLRPAGASPVPDAAGARAPGVLRAAAWRVPGRSGGQRVARAQHDGPGLARRDQVRRRPARRAARAGPLRGPEAAAGHRRGHPKEPPGDLPGRAHVRFGGHGVMARA